MKKKKKKKVINKVKRIYMNEQKEWIIIRIIIETMAKL